MDNAPYESRGTALRAGPGDSTVVSGPQKRAPRLSFPDVVESLACSGELLAQPDREVAHFYFPLHEVG